MNDVYIYNTLTNKKELFSPLVPGNISMYTCGITTYDHIHLGHARSAFFSDLVYRFFKDVGYKIKHVKNFTDIDDKIIIRSKNLGIYWLELSNKIIKSHNKDLKQLRISIPTITPRASEYITEMIEMIKILIKKGIAYPSAGDVYFSTKSFGEYGKLSGKKLDQLIIGQRVKPNDKKKDEFDFALWKKSSKSEPGFDSPWSFGRPGWHIECSAMIRNILGDNIDIHIGGSDLIFPHHENEIAQSESLNSKGRFSNYWLHHAMVMIDGQKMSKSLNNFVNVNKLLKIYHPEIIKLCFLSVHYRKIIDFNERFLETIKEGLDRIYNSLYQVKNSVNSQNIDSELILEFKKAIADDFNTPKAISLIFNWVKLLNKSDEKNKKKLANTIIKAGNLINILHESPKGWFNQQRINSNKQQISTEDITKLIKKRNMARQEKDWQLSDEIRDYLKNHNIAVLDKKNESTWKRLK